MVASKSHSKNTQLPATALPVTLATDSAAPLKEAPLLRTKHQGCFTKRKVRHWGHYLTPAADPEGRDVTQAQLDKFYIPESFVPLPADLFSAIYKLYLHFAQAHHAPLEVSVLLLRDTDTFKQWKVVVPVQTVSGARVDAVLKTTVDILTGERYEVFPPEGWAHSGSSHSHNRMGAFFSGTDDEHELPVNGLHFVIGSLHKPQGEIAVSVVHAMRRFLAVDIDRLLNNRLTEATFHPAVLAVVSIQNPKALSAAQHPLISKQPGGLSNLFGRPQTQQTPKAQASSLQASAIEQALLRRSRDDQYLPGWDSYEYADDTSLQEANFTPQVNSLVGDVEACFAELDALVTTERPEVGQYIQELLDLYFTV